MVITCRFHLKLIPMKIHFTAKNPNKVIPTPPPFQYNFLIPITWLNLENPFLLFSPINFRLDFSRNLTHCNASLLVNDTLAMSGDQPTWLKLLPSRMHTPDAIQNTWLHLGGAPQAPIGLIIELPPAQSGTGFTGCLHSLRINGEDRDIFE